MIFLEGGHLKSHHGLLGKKWSCVCVCVVESERKRYSDVWNAVLF